MKKLLSTISPLAIIILCGIAQVQAKPLKVFILAGQSNMEGFGGINTFGHIAMDPEAAPMLELMQDRDGNPVVLDDVYISYNEKHGKLTGGFGCSSQKIGPEFTFGIYLHEALKEPFLLIKTAWGGKSLNRDFRPPSAMKDLEDGADERNGKHYQMMMEQVNKVLADPGKYHPAYDPAEGYEVAGFVWFQGYNDEIDKKVYPNGHEEGGYDLYTRLMAQLIRDMRKELNAPDMKAVIGVIGVGGPEAKGDLTDKQKINWKRRANFREAQAAVAEMPEFKDTVAAVPTAQYWDYQLEDLDSRMGGIYQKLRKAGKESLSKSERNELKQKLYDETFTEEELSLYWKARSAQSFHYMGSAKIYAQIGRDLAKAMWELEVGR